MKNPFENIKLSQLYCLCKIIAESELRNKDYIRNKYQDSALFFEETQTLLEQLNVIKTREEELKFDKSFDFANSIEDFKIRILAKLFHDNNSISTYLTDFLLNFKIESNDIIFKPSLTDKIKYGDIRNILLELDFIFIKEDNGFYVINKQYNDLFLNKINNSEVSIEAFNKNKNAKDALGLLAEKAVIDYEMKHLTKVEVALEDIEHTSQRNVYAGYDIRSIENYLDDNLNKIAKYIEVKAVSLSDFNFFWSRNEIEKAKILGVRYYLYLLPVKEKQTFDFENLLIINNPFQNIYLNNSDWIKQEETLSLRKKVIMII